VFPDQSFLIARWKIQKVIAKSGRKLFHASRMVLAVLKARQGHGAVGSQPKSKHANITVLFPEMESNSNRTPSLAAATASEGFILTFFQYLTRSGALILIVLSFLKMLESKQDAIYFQEADSVIQVFSNRQMMLIASAFEILVGTYAWFVPSLRKRSYALLWFCCVVAIYKVGRYFTHAIYPCTCLGILTKWLKLNRNEADTISWLCLFFLAAVSVGFLFWRSRQSNRTKLPTPS
jgi:hypothetical protein